MSILIRGMEMPKSCCECAIKSWNGEDDVCPFSWVSALGIGRQDDCPLVPVPPHGRLIDADALCMKLKMMYAQAFADGNSAYHSAYRSLEKVVNAAPTIIQTEEGE